MEAENLYLSLTRSLLSLVLIPPLTHPSYLPVVLSAYRLHFDQSRVTRRCCYGSYQQVLPERTWRHILNYLHVCYNILYFNVLYHISCPNVDAFKMSQFKSDTSKNVNKLLSVNLTQKNRQKLNTQMLPFLVLNIYHKCWVDFFVDFFLFLYKPMLKISSFISTWNECKKQNRNQLRKLIAGNERRV